MKKPPTNRPRRAGATRRPHVHRRQAAAPPGAARPAGARRSRQPRRALSAWPLGPIAWPGLGKGWQRQHHRAARHAVEQLRRQPMTSWMTIAVIAIALALPAGLSQGLEQIQHWAGSWHGQATQLSLFLRPGSTDAQAGELAETLTQRPDIADASVITRAEALAELRRNGDFEAALGMLEDNPLPPVVVVTPTPTEAGALTRLQAALGEYAGVDTVTLDREWLRRLEALLSVGGRLAALTALLLGLAVVAIVGNTIRLEIQNRRAEIELHKLLGATDAYVRRPFLYLGGLYGLAGGIAALVLLWLGGLYLQPAVSELSHLYGTAGGEPGREAHAPSLGVVGGGILLGLAGAYLSVRHHLRQIEPT